MDWSRDFSHALLFTASGPHREILPRIHGRYLTTGLTRILVLVPLRDAAGRADACKFIDNLSISFTLY